MTAANHAGHMVAPLLQELKNSEQIIIAMLNAMTAAQKSKVHAKLEADGVSGEGMSRHHERRAAIVATETALAQPAAVQSQPDPLVQDVAEIANCRKSFLEMTYGQFYDPAIQAADAAHPGAGDLMRDLNRIFSLCDGMATVMRIAAGNDVLEDFHDPDDADSAPPLSLAAINSLTTMTATVCEWIADDISRTSDRFNERGEKA